MTKLEEIIKTIEKMNAEELKILYGIIVKMLATPLQNPHNYFDDWDNVEVDKAYAESW